ncbi:carbohydrate kinase [Halorubrum sp. BOL3-1]|uniref:carbohydrate kinase family protein n=1 Tax=Halorubrum sp. BOL3-1 TaxID=2497325 RepID=UPI0010050694|nr:carbohydrate kinase [Halorubrum sp. BOL3-1]QAU12277.1 carbohydrate kinase [Halorubrum sp. BOL3-1]
MVREVLVAGETLIDFIPDRPGSLATVESFSRQAGGAPANVAVGLARLDRTPWFCTALATDAFGDHLASVLDREGIPDRFVSREPDAQTALAFVSHGADADREFTFYRAETADRRFDASGVPDEVLESVDVVAVGGVTLTVEPARSATFDLVERAREAGCRVLFDPNVRPELWEVESEPTMRRALSLTDVLKASREDLVEGTLPNEPEELLDAGPDAVFLTEGDAGARLIAAADAPWGRGEWRHDGYRVDDVVDTTGAGDAFTAGVVAGLVDGSPPEELLGFANAVAAASTRHAGAMTALPDRETVERLREGD